MSVQFYDAQGHAHFLTFSCHKRKSLFLDDHLYQLFMDQLHIVRDRDMFKLWAYVIMPNHVHLVIYPLVPMSRILRALKQGFSRKALDYIKRQYPAVYSDLKVTTGKKQQHRFWLEGGGYDRNVNMPDVIRKQIEYVHNNPVRWGLVEYPERWPWSSASFYISGIHGPINIDLPIF